MFLAPIFLLGLLATSIPLILHLRRSTRHKRIVFSTTRFFDEQFIRSARRARVQDKLLMLLRIALLALFVLALAQPLVRFRGLSYLTGERREVAIVLDDSASMGLVTDKGTLLDQAKGGALALINKLSSTRGDKATVILAGRRESGTKVLIAEPTSDFNAVRSAINSVKVTDLATDINSAVDRAGKVLSGAGGGEAAGSGSGTATGAGTPTSASGSREIYVFSDMQETGFAPGQKLSPGPGVLLVFVSTAAEPALVQENLSVDAVQYGSPRPMLGTPFTFRALLTNHSDHPRNTTASLVIDGQTVGQKAVEIPGGRSHIVRFTHRFTKTGWFGGYVEIKPGNLVPAASSEANPTNTTATTAPATTDAGIDSFAFDNRRSFALLVESKLRILAINGAPSAVPANDELFFIRLALTVNPQSTPTSGSSASGSSGGIQIDQKSPAEVDKAQLNDYPLVILANVASLTPESLEALEKYVDGGGNLFITLGNRVDPKVYADWIGESRLHGGLLPGRITKLVGSLSPLADQPTTAPSDEPADAGFIASIADDHPMLAGFGDGQLGNLASVHFSARYNLDAPTDSVLMRGPAGEPIMAEKRFGRGHVLLFASTLGRDWTNFPLQPVFVPWIYRVVSYLSQGGLEAGGFVRTGQTVHLPSSTTQVEALQAVCPDGTVAFPEPAAAANSGSANEMVLNDAEQAGVYTVRAGNNGPTRLLFAANVPSDEGDPISLDKAAIGNLIDSNTAWDYAQGAESAADIGQKARQGYGLWDQLLFVALLIGLLEPWLANRISKRRAAVSPDAMSKRDVASPSKPTEARPAA